jgi:hypothetical protein
MTDFDFIYKFAKSFHKKADGDGEFWLSDEGLEPAPLKNIEPFDFKKDRDSKEVLHTVGDEGDLLIIDDTIFVWELDAETKEKIISRLSDLETKGVLKVEETSTGNEIDLSEIESEPETKLASIASKLEKIVKKN